MEPNNQPSLTDLLRQDVEDLLATQGYSSDQITNLSDALKAKWENERPQLNTLSADFRPSGNSAVSKPTSNIPTVAPALWQKDRFSKETPAAFIQRHYAPWIENGLSRADLRHLDKPLYVALSQWVGRKGNELPFDLPTLKEKNDRWVERVARSMEDQSETLIPAREANRFSSVVQRRRAKERGTEVG